MQINTKKTHAFLKSRVILSIKKIYPLATIITAPIKVINKVFNKINLMIINFSIITILISFSFLWAYISINTKLTERSQAQISLNIQLILESLLSASHHWSYERALTILALYADDASTTEINNTITAERAISWKLLRAALDDLTAHPITANLVDDISRVERDYGYIQEARESIDSEIIKSNDVRYVAIGNDFFHQITSLIDLIQILRQKIQFSTDRTSNTVYKRDSVVSELSAILNLTWIMSEYTDRVRADIVELISSKIPVSEELNIKITEYRSVVDYAWRGLDALIGEHSELNTSSKLIRDSLANFRSHRSSILEAGISGIDYPMTASTWIKNSSNFIDVIQQLQSNTSNIIKNYLQRQLDSADSDVKFYFIIIAITILSSILAVLIVNFRQIQPLRAMAFTVNCLASGNTAVDVANTERQDEIGAIANSLEVFKTGLIQAKNLAERERNEQAIKGMRSNRLAAMVAEFNHLAAQALAAISGAATDLENTAHNMTAVTRRTNEQATQANMEQQHVSTNVQTVAAATEEMVASIQEITGQMDHSRTIAESCVKEVQQVNQTVDGLEVTAQKIGSIIELIRAIAEQTNLLALNATIEAARAGDAGRGFAVVASEVKTLAAQTAAATGEISDQISNIQSISQATAKAIHAIGQTIQSMNEITIAIAGAMEQQQASTSDISRNIHQAFSATISVLENIKVMTSAVGETEQTSDHVLNSSLDLSRQIKILKNDITLFTENVQSL